MKLRSAVTLLLSSLVAVGSVTAMAQSAKTPPPTRIKVPNIPYEKYKLKNGLEVILVQDSRLPMVAVDLWYHVGPVNERAGRTGFAHLFEHMMFEGSKHVGEKSHFKYLEAAGASDINGTTDFDRTNYFETVPSNQLELALWLESDRMGFLLDTLDAPKLTNQRDVVRNERRQSTENQPYGLVEEALFHQLFPKTHPYYANVIGSHEDIEAARLTDVRDFFKQYYTPNNATIAIVGNIDKAQTKQLVEKYFGPLSSGPAVPPVKVETPAITSERRQVVTDAVQLPRVYMAWLTPPAFKPGDAEADMLARILGGGKSSRMYQKLVYQQQIAQQVSCSHNSLQLGSPFICEITARPGVKPEQLEAAANAEIDALMKDGPSATELERARNITESEIIRSLQRLGGFGGVADMLNTFNQYLGDPGYLPKLIATYDRLTTADLQKNAQTMLAKDRRVVVYGVPGQKQVTDVPRSPADTDANVKITPEYTEQFEKSQAWRASAPKPGPNPTLNLPVPKELALKNGMKLLVVENHSLPIVSVRFVTLGGLEAEDLRKPGTAGFTAAMLSQGTVRRTAPQIADEADQLGATLANNAGTDEANVGMTMLANNLPRSLDLLSDLVLNPAFKAEEIERVRKERQTALLQLRDQPTQLAMTISNRVLFGSENPYGYISLGTRKSLEEMNREDLQKFWSTHYSPKSSALVFSGDITPQKAQELADKYFGAWNNNGSGSTPPKPSALPTRQIVLVDHPGAPQSTIFAAGIGISRSCPDYPAVTVMNTMLGGLFSSRINMNLREKHGYTYGAFSFIPAHRGPGPFLAGAEVRTDVTQPAVTELFAELERIRTTPLSNDELRMSKDYIMRSLPGDFETVDGTTKRVADIWTYGLPLDYYQKYPQQVEAVTADDAKQAALKYIQPEKMILVTVGDKAKIEPSLRDMNLGPIEHWTDDGEPLNQPAGSN